MRPARPRSQPRLTAAPPTMYQLLPQYRHCQKQNSADQLATNSEADPSESTFGIAAATTAATVANNSQQLTTQLTVHSFIDRFKNSLIGGLLRRNFTPRARHNVGSSDQPTDEDAEADASDGGADNGEGGANGAAAKIGEDAAAKQAASARKRKSRKTLSRMAAAIEAAEELYSVDTDMYSLSSVLEQFARQQIPMPHAMKFILGRRPSRPRTNRSRDHGDHATEGLLDEGNDPLRCCCVHPLLDRVAEQFCRRLGMMEVARRPTFQERMFLWLSRDQAQCVLANDCGPGEQVYFVNLVNLDHVMTDLQCLVARLTGCVACEGQTYPAHCCTDRNKIREQHRGPHLRPPRVVFVDRQVMCRHIYLRQDFGMACDEKGCPNYGKRLCACFQTDMFIPDTEVLGTKRKFEHIRANLVNKVYGDQRWLLRAPRLKGGNGLQLIDTAAQLETFMRYDLTRRLRGQFFVMQRLLKNPLLLEGRRFDIRMFLLVCVLTERRVVAFLHPGYLRLAQKEYQPDSNDLRCHFTWPFVWDPEYNRYAAKKKTGPATDSSAPAAAEKPPKEDNESQPVAKEDGTADTAKDEVGDQKDAQPPDYCRPYAESCEALGLPELVCSREFDSIVRDAAGGNETQQQQRFLYRLHRIVQRLVGQIDSLVADKPGTWQLFGLDLVVDADKEVWLHDVMTYPCRDEPDPRSPAQGRVLAATLTEALALVLELNQRDCATRSEGLWMDLPDVPVNQQGLIVAQKNFLWMYSSDVDRLLGARPHRRRTKAPHWYRQWRVMEDYNDYILYLKNYRLDNFALDTNDILYGRKTFEHSPAHKFRLTMIKPAEAERDAREKEKENEAKQEG